MNSVVCCLSLKMELFVVTSWYHNSRQILQQKWIQQLLTSADRELIAEDQSKITFFSGRSRISQTGNGAPTYFLAIYFQTLHENKKVLLRETARGVPPAAYPSPGREGVGYPPPKGPGTRERTWDWFTPWKEPDTRDHGKNLGLGYTKWKHYLPASFGMRAVNKIN